MEEVVGSIPISSTSKMTREFWRETAHREHVCAIYAKR
jgi:hypothetical protein